MREVQQQCFIEKMSDDGGTKMKKFIALLLFSTVVTGCATTGGAAERWNTEQGWYCCARVWGCRGSDRPSYLSVGGRECCGVCGRYGRTALVGAGACYGLASHYEQRRKDLAGKEQDVDALLAFAKTNNAEAEKTNQQLNAKLIEVSTRTDVIALQIQQGTITSSRLAKEKEALQKERQAANEQVEVQKVALQDMKSLRSKLPSQATEDNARIAELDAEIAKQERLLAEAQRTTTAFATQSGRI